MTNFTQINVQNLRHLMKRIFHCQKEMKYMEKNMLKMFVTAHVHMKNSMEMKIKYIVVAFLEEKRKKTIKSKQTLLIIK